MSISGKRICFVIGGLNVGGAEKQFVNSINYMFETGFALSVEVLVLSEMNPTGLQEQIDKNVKIKNISMRMRSAPKNIIKMARFFREKNFDIVHSHMFWASFYSSVALLFCPSIKFYTTEHGMNPWKKTYHFLIERWLITQRAVKRICVSKAICENRKNVEKIPATKLAVIPNGVKIPEHIAEPFLQKNEPIKIVAVGRLIEAKSYGCLIEAASILKQKGCVFTLNILGDGPLKAALSAQLVELNLQQNVFLQGSRSDVEKWYLNSDIFVMSSIREGMPMAILEAMSLALPIVATSVGGIPNTLLNGKEGVLVQSAQPKKIAEAIEYYIDHKAKAREMGMAARQRVKENFSVQANASALQTLYSE